MSIATESLSKAKKKRKDMMKGSEASLTALASSSTGDTEGGGCAEERTL